MKGIGFPQIKKYHQKYYITVKHGIVANTKIDWRKYDEVFIWTKRRLTYLKKHKRILYVNLLTSGKLTEHLNEIDTTAIERWETIIRQMAQEQGIPEQLKASNQILWVGRMNNVCVCTDEIILNELIYN